MAKNNLSMQDLFGGAGQSSSNLSSVGLRGIMKSGDLKPGKALTYEDVHFKNLDGKNRASDQEVADKKKITELEREVENLKHQLETQRIELSQKAIEASNAAKVKALKEGEEMGEARSQALFDGQLAEIKSQLGALLQSLSQEKEAFFKQVEIGTKTLLTTGLTKLNHELDQRSENVLEKVVSEVFSILGNESELVLKLNPADFQIHEADAQFWLPLEASQVNLKVMEDPRVQKGGCRLETEAGTIDARRELMVAKLSNIIEVAFDQMFSPAPDEIPVAEEPVNEAMNPENPNPEAQSE